MVGQITLGWLGYPITVLFVVWMVNLYNFMDGIDGLAAGMAVIGFAALAGVAWKNESMGLTLLGFITVAASGGFLVSNFPPARIFMGDVGSITLGFLVGAYTLRASHDRIFESWIPFIAFSPFIVDTTVTVLARAFRRERILEPHLQHSYQRLVLAGWSHRRTVLVEYALMIGCGVAAYLYLENTETAKVAILLILTGVYVALALGVRLVEARCRKRAAR
jgi:UDP-N-acetylmuramyl pentapeptide phosphotransferase/UDP-N-acetylglucosamine-1-phosphate transferase